MSSLHDDAADLKQPREKHTTEPLNTKVTSVAQQYHLKFECEKEYDYRAIEYRSSLDVELALLLAIYEWTPTFEIGHLPSE